MSPLEEVVKERIVRENTVFQVVHILFAPVAHGVDLLKGLNRRTSIASSRDRVTDIAVKAAKRLQVAIFFTESRCAQHFVAFLRIPIMSTGMVNEL
jgi:hypothetical protein